MNAPTRRGLLGGAAALASAPVVSAAAPVNPDAELLAACAEFDGWERIYRATDFEANRDTPAGEAAHAKRQQCIEAQKPLLARMVEIRSATLAGHAARARSLALWEDDDPSGDVDSGFVNERLLGAILRDLTEAAGG